MMVQQGCFRLQHVPEATTLYDKREEEMSSRVPSGAVSVSKTRVEIRTRSSTRGDSESCGEAWGLLHRSRPSVEKIRRACVTSGSTCCSVGLWVNSFVGAMVRSCRSRISGYCSTNSARLSARTSRRPSTNRCNSVSLAAYTSPENRRSPAIRTKADQLIRLRNDFMRRRPALLACTRRREPWRSKEGNNLDQSWHGGRGYGRRRYSSSGHN